MVTDLLKFVRGVSNLSGNLNGQCKIISIIWSSDNFPTMMYKSIKGRCGIRKAATYRDLGGSLETHQFCNLQVCGSLESSSCCHFFFAETLISDLAPYRF